MSGLLFFFSYDKYDKTESAIKTIEKIPIKIETWQGKDLPIENLVYETLLTKSIIQRIYSSKNDAVFLSIVYYPETKVAFHGPTDCLKAQGHQIIQISHNKINFIYNDKMVALKVNQLILQKQGDKRLVYYFFKAGEFIGRDYIKLRFNLAINKITKNAKSGSLIRITTGIHDDDIQKASNILRDFVKDLYPFLIAYL